MKKKYLSLCLIFLLLLSLTACGGNSKGGSSDSSSITSAPQAAADFNLEAGQNMSTTASDAAAEMGWEEPDAPLTEGS